MYVRALERVDHSVQLFNLVSTTDQNYILYMLLYMLLEDFFKLFLFPV